MPPRTPAGQGTRPLVSVGLPVHDGADEVGRAIESVLDQELRDLELVISDNASTDGTGAVCRDYAARDGRIRYSRTQRATGAVPNFNRAFTLARGRYFKWLGHDDVLAPGALGRATQVLETRPSVVLCHWHETIVDGQGRTLRTYDTGSDFQVSASRPGARFREMLWAGRRGSRGDPLYGLIRADALARTHLLRETFHPNMLLLQELSLLGAFHTLPETLAHRRYNDERTTVPELLPWLGRRGGRIRLPHLRHVLDYLRLVRETDLLEGWEQRRVEAALLRYFLSPRRWRGYAWDLLKGAWILGGTRSATGELRRAPDPSRPDAARPTQAARARGDRGR